MRACETKIGLYANCKSSRAKVGHMNPGIEEEIDACITIIEKAYEGYRQGDKKFCLNYKKFKL